MLDSNPVDEIIKNPSCPIKSRAFFLNEKLTGLSYKDKIKQTLQGFEGDALIITKPEDLCWLLNIRASDIEFNPLLLTYAILFKNGDIDLFLDEERLADLDSSYLKNINLIQENCFDLRISFLKKQIKKIQIDKNATNYWLYSLLKKNDFEIIF